MMYGQTRVFFVMARDGLLPEKLSTVHPRFKTPYIVTIVTGCFVAVAAAFVASFIGLLLSYYLNLPTGPAIILTSGAGYLISMLIGVQGGLLWQLVPRKHLEA